MTTASYPEDPSSGFYFVRKGVGEIAEESQKTVNALIRICASSPDVI